TFVGAPTRGVGEREHIGDYRVGIAALSSCDRHSGDPPALPSHAIRAFTRKTPLPFPAACVRRQLIQRLNQPHRTDSGNPSD
ncbi:hypothetical protein LXJ58_33325, partial [Escherichia coli]|nr:hypothetical protein [Escherichia coli]